MSEAEYISTKQLAAYTGLSEPYWANLRSQGGGPAYIKLAKHVRYRRAEVDRWLAERERASTFAKNTPDAAAA